MKTVFQNYDLFPDTLLVEMVDGVPMTSSLKIAGRFGKKHKDVMRTIRAVLDQTKNEGHRRNFAPMSGKDERNRPRDFYLLTEKGFQFVVTGFTGEAATDWKWSFLDQFEEMRNVLVARTTRYAHALDLVRPSLRPVVEGTEAGKSRAEIAQPLGKSVASITYHRKQAKHLALLSTQNP